MTDHDELSALRAEMQQMAAELVAVRTELAELGSTAGSAALTEAPVIEIDTAVTRRGWMKAAAVAAVGGTALALGSGDEVAAADTDSIKIGQTNNVGDARTRATQTPNSRAEMSFLFRTETAAGGATAYFPAALGGWTGASARPNGIYGYTSVNNEDANGVVGVSESRLGFGVRAENSEIGGSALYAGATGNGGTGAFARGGFVGLAAQGNQFGLTAVGDIAAVLLEPVNPTAPPDRSDGQTGGSLDVQRLSDSGAASLWFCSAPGSPGTWQKLAGPFTAGAFHALAPARAFDSRQAQPDPGALASGSSRVVSVADGRNPTTGAVTRAGLVPDGATAITYNLTIDRTVGSGFLALAPGSASSSDASSINWTSGGTIVANAGVVKLDLNRQIKVFCSGGGSTDFIIDVTGYYL